MGAETARRGVGVRMARSLIRAYQLTLSALVGRSCRHLPTCSAYTDEAIGAYGVWAGSWMGLARLCRCHPLGTSGLDLVPAAVPVGARWYAPWRYGRWRGVNVPLVCEEVAQAHRGRRVEVAVRAPSRRPD